jgi:hypothetical protein
MCVYMHSRFVENHPIWILNDRPLIFEVVLSHILYGWLNFKKKYYVFVPLILIYFMFLFKFVLA